jgi:hypothetical protein
MKMPIFIASGVIGAVLGLATGFVTYKATAGWTVDFVRWATNESWGHPLDALCWTIGGIIVGIAAAYIRSLNSN